MNKTIQILIIVAAVLVIAVALLGAGFFIGRVAWGWNSYHPANMMGFFSRDGRDARFGYGMMDGRVGPGMMGGFSDYQKDGDQFPYGHGMMGGYSTNAQPLSVEESLEAVEAYLAQFETTDLVVAEIMVFDNNSYAIIKEESTGFGAFELLVDPASKAVYPEYGPNMMWNLKYGMHPSGASDEAMTISPEAAVSLAQEYLDANAAGLQVSDHADTFYGYYTLHTLEDGEVTGMLSVNGYTGDVFVHTWHGDFVEMTAEHAD